MTNLVVSAFKIFSEEEKRLPERYLIQLVNHKEVPCDAQRYF